MKRWVTWTVLAAVVATIGYVVYRENIDVRGAFRAARSVSGEAATTASVKAALALSRKVSAFDINVDTQGGVVRLRGRVPSDEIRRLAVAIASDTKGVVRVEDRLLIDETTRPDPEITRLERRIADLELESALMSALEGHPDLAEHDLTVEVAGGEVTLSGTVPDEASRYGAETLASGLDGVRTITNEIEVTEPESVSVAEERDELARKVEFELFKTEAFNLEQMTVRANDENVVTLEGMTRSQAERLLAERIAASVDEVEGVINRLEVLELTPEV